MTWTFEIDPAQRLVTVHLTEGFTPQNFAEATQAIQKHRDYTPDLRQLVIFDNAFASGFTGDVVSKLARAPASFSKSSRRAIVTSTDLDFGFARMFKGLKVGSAGEIAVFREFEEALTWLESGED